MSSVVLTQYTDPNCTWSWGAEPILRHLEVVYGHELRIEFVLGGLVEDFETFHDVSNDIRNPGDVAPHWEEASRKHGMPVDADVWTEDPPRSTWPASIAIKAAGLQDPLLGLRYLRRTREVAATERRNIARRDTLVEVARSVGVDPDRLVDDMEDGKAEEAFRSDMRRMRNRGIRGFPTYELEVDGDTRILGGFLPFDVLETRLRQHVRGLEPRERPSIRSFVEAYGYVATREVAEIARRPSRQVTGELERLESRGVLRSVERGNGRFWLPSAERGVVERRGTGEFSRGSSSRALQAATFRSAS